MQIGCYTLDIYCDCDAPMNYLSNPVPYGHEHAEFPKQFTGSSLASCVRQAKQLGWMFTKFGEVCPNCRHMNRRPRKEEESTNNDRA